MGCLTLSSDDVPEKESQRWGLLITLSCDDVPEKGLAVGCLTMSCDDVPEKER